MSLCFRRAEVTDIASMQTLWELCFPEDDRAYIRHFFERTPIESGLVACKGEVLAMLFLLPAQAVFCGNSLPVRYLYAGCTHPEHRRQGIYEQLLAYAARQTVEMGACAIYLHPATDRLAAYYRRCGYRTGIGCWRQQTDCRSGRTAAAGSAAGYLEAREGFLQALPAVWRLDPPYEQYFLQDMLQDGWMAYADDTGCGLVSDDGQIGYDCHRVHLGATCCGSDTAGEWNESALWLPVTACPELLDGMNTTCAYTALMGEI